MRTRPRMSAGPICLALGLGLGGCATRPGPPPAAQRAPPGITGVIVALRPVPWRSLGTDPLGAAGAPAGPPQPYAEIVIRDGDGRTRTVVAPLTADLVPGRDVRVGADGARLGP